VNKLSKTALAVLLAVIVIIAVVAGVYYFMFQQKKPEEITGKIDFYTSIPKPIAVELVEMFNKKYPNIKVNLIRQGTTKILAKLYAEIEADKIICDVIWVADPSGIIDLKNKGLLMKYTPSVADKIPFRDPDGYWWAGRIIIPVIAYNTELVKTLPKRWTDLIDPNYRKNLPDPWKTGEGWCAIPNPLYSGSAVANVYALSKKYGWDFFKKLRANGVIVLKSNTVVLNNIVNKECPIGVTLDYMVRKAAGEGVSVKYLFPEEGIVIIPSPIAIMKDTPYPEAAKIFVEYMLSEEVQKKLAELGVIPGRSDIAPPEGVPSLDKVPKLNIDWDELARELETVRSTFEEIMLKG